MVGSKERLADRYLSQAYLPGTGDYRDPWGGSPRVRPSHCTPVGLTFAIAPNAGDSGAQFLLVGDCVRADPWVKSKKNCYLSFFFLCRMSRVQGRWSSNSGNSLVLQTFFTLLVIFVTRWGRVPSLLICHNTWQLWYLHISNHQRR